MTWQEIKDRTDLEGGTIVVKEQHCVWTGRVVTLSLHGDENEKCLIHLESRGDLSKTYVFRTENSYPVYLGGSIRFSVDGIGQFEIVPMSDSRPALV